MRQTGLALAAAAALMAIGAAPAAANHSWGGYHWARTANPFTLQLGDNVSTAWDAYLAGASADWSQSTAGNPVRTAVVTGGSSGRRCAATSGRVEVCNAAYGFNGWLGVASVWASGSHITQATVKVNDSYYAYAPYNSPTWRAMVMCQELGHTFGLDHQDESGADFHTCMDYASSPDADNMHPNGHDYEQLALIYSHLDSFTTLAGATGDSGGTGKGNGKGPKRIDDDLFVEDLGGGRKRFIHVLWVDRGRHHAAPPAGA